MYANECNRELIIPGKILPLFLGRLLREPPIDSSGIDGSSALSLLPLGVHFGMLRLESGYIGERLPLFLKEEPLTDVANVRAQHVADPMRCAVQLVAHPVGNREE